MVKMHYKLSEMETNTAWVSLLGFFFIVFSKSKQRFCFLATFSQYFQITIAGNTAVRKSIFHKHKAYNFDESKLCIYGVRDLLNKLL